MKRKSAMLIVFIMLFNILFTGLTFDEVFGNPTYGAIINKINIREIIEGNASSYRISFNMTTTANIDAIHVWQGTGIVKTISKSELVVVNGSRLDYIPEGSGLSIQSVFGVTGGEIYFSVDRNGKDDFIPNIDNKFEIPDSSFNFIKVNGINDLSYASWPTTVITGEELTIDGAYFGFGLGYAYRLGITSGDTVNNSVNYTLNNNNKITIEEADTENITVGNNQNLVFELLNHFSKVDISYVVKNAINVAKPLDLGSKVDISPLEGTEGTIVRIKADKHTPLLDLGTKVYIGGVEAKRNVGPFSSNGIFTYYEGAVEKYGLEVIVSKHVQSGPKQIVIRNAFNSTYIHSDDFNYSGTLGTVLEVTDINPSKGFTNFENIVDGLSVRNIAALNNIPKKHSNVNHENVKDTTTDINQLKYFKAEPKSSYIKYELNGSPGYFVERKITVFMGLKAEINSASLENALLKIKDTITTNPTQSYDISTLQVKTDKVNQAGNYVVSVRTETVYYYEHPVNGVMELEYIVEEAPYTNQTKKYYEYQPDTSTPIIQKITPNKGPYDEVILATIEGQQFTVEVSGQNRFYPRVIMGSTAIADGDYRYKVITKDEKGVPYAYFSSRSDGSIETIGSRISPYFDFEVLTNNNTVVDGQSVKVGTKIKFAIPPGTNIYTGYADVTVYNPSPTGQLGGRDTKENFFQYINPGAGVLRPVIDSIVPDKVAVGKQEQVVINGRNFYKDTLVTIDGEVVLNPTIDIVKGTITFKAPIGRAGLTLLQVINPDGGMASKEFEYIQTHSQPTIQKIIPNVGGMGSLVIIKGTGFYTANSHPDYDDNRKIGTKIYIDGKDINDYYYRDNQVPAQLELTEFVNIYEPGQPLIKGPNGQPIMTYGSNVAVVDNETIYMIVPDPRNISKPFFMNEFLDVMAVNPDLGKHELKKGFKFIDVVVRPRIDDIAPILGDYRGGNIVEITGDGFNEGVKVYFGTQEAQVYRRSNNAKMVWVYVPAYDQPLGSKNSAFVPVTVLNTNGSSITRYNGYEYVNPGYDVKIAKITPNIGNTSGGDRILISGVNFRAENYGKANEKLPAVYFGGVKVPEDKITFVLPPKADYADVEVSDMIIVEHTPPNPAGKVDVTVINFDGATANLKSGFEYRSKQPAITNVLPRQGTVYGGSEITITGRDFVANGLHVVFGDEVAKQDILSGQAVVRLGDIFVSYNAYDPENIKLYYKQMLPGNELNVHKDSLFTNSFKIIEEEEYIIVRVNWKGLPAHLADDTTVNMADENIKIEIKNNDLILTRRLGVVKRVEDDNRIVVVTPPGKQVGKTSLTVYNYDGKNAKSDFTYTNPFMPPVITEINPVSEVTVTEINGVPYTGNNPIKVAQAAPSGGSPLIITGENFRSGVKVFIDGKEAVIKNKSANDDELIIVVPAANTDSIGKYLRILVLNEDGGAAYGDEVAPNPFYFRYITEGSFPKITSVTPAVGPASGGTKVTIKGTEFKNMDSFNNPKVVQVLVGGVPVPQNQVTYINPETLEVIMPAGRIGKQTIEVINYDYGRAIGTDIFTYISQPEIITVNPGKLFTNDTNTEVTISGRQFMPGAKLIIGGQIMLEKDVQPGQTITARGIRGVDANGKNREMVVVGGIEAAKVVVENENILKVNFNEAFDLVNNHLIVVNTDGGLSSEYRNFQYLIPVPNKPLVLEGIPGAESTVLLVWSDSLPEVLNRADRYEIYGRKASDKQYVFLGDTRGTDFLVQGLDQNQSYSFMVRAMNRYGSALEFAEVTVRTFNEREDQQLKEKQDIIKAEDQKVKKEGKEEINGVTVIRTIGTEEVSAGTTAYKIDFSLSKYSKQNKYVVAIPISVVQNLDRRIMITDGTISYTLLPKDLFTREVSQMNTQNLNDAYVRVTVERLVGQNGESIVTAIDRNQRRASDVYEISFDLQVGSSITTIGGMLRNGELSIKFEEVAYPTANKNKLFIGQYDASKHSFTKLNGGNTANTRDRGRYMLLSER